MISRCSPRGFAAALLAVAIITTACTQTPPAPTAPPAASPPPAATTALAPSPAPAATSPSPAAAASPASAASPAASPASVSSPAAAASPAPGASASPAASPSPVAALPAAAGAVNFWVFGDPEEVKVFQALVDAYKSANPSVNVTLSATASQGDYITKLQTAFAGNTAPDVFLVNYRRYGQFAGRNLIEPAEGWLQRTGRLKKEDFYETSLAAFTTAGQLQCIPQNLSSLAVYYNRDLFTQRNVPLPKADWTWADFLDAAKKLTGDGKHGVGVEPQLVRAASFIWQHGGKLVDNEAAPARLTFDDPKTLEAMKWFVELSTVHKVVPNQAEVKAEDLDARFMSGKLGMRLDSRRAVPDYRTIKGFTWDVAPLPRDASAATVLHSDAYCMSATSANKAAAWDFVSWANGTDGQRLASRLGRTVPSLKAVATSADFLDTALPPASSKVWLDAATTIKLLPIVPELPGIESALNAEIERAFYGANFDEAMTTANQKANDLLKR